MPNTPINYYGWANNSSSTMANQYYVPNQWSYNVQTIVVENPEPIVMGSRKTHKSVKKEESPLEWLDRRVEEICELVAA